MPYTHTNIVINRSGEEHRVGAYRIQDGFLSALIACQRAHVDSNRREENMSQQTQKRTAKGNHTLSAIISIALASALAITGVSATSLRWDDPATAAETNQALQAQAVQQDQAQAVPAAGDELNPLVSFADDLVFEKDSPEIGSDPLQSVLSPDVTSSRIAYMKQAHPQGQPVALGDIEVEDQPLMAYNAAGETDALGYTSYPFPTGNLSLTSGTYENYIDRIDYSKASYALEFYDQLSSMHQLDGKMAKDSTFDVNSDDNPMFLSNAEPATVYRGYTKNPTPVYENGVLVGYDVDFDLMLLSSTLLRTPNGTAIAPYASSIKQNYYSAWYAFLCDHPECFFASRRPPVVQLQPVPNYTDRYVVLVLLYQVSADSNYSDFIWRAPDWDEAAIGTSWAAQEAAISTFLSGATGNEYQRLSYFNEQLCAKNVYADPIPDINETYTAWVALTALADTGKDPVCESYSRALQLLCQRAGIGCTVGTGDSIAGAHMWNQVRVGGKWYCCDVTWNDSTGYAGHYTRYFLVKRSFFESEHFIRNTYYSVLSDEDKTKISSDYLAALYDLPILNHPPLEDSNCDPASLELMDPTINVPESALSVPYGTKATDIPSLLDEHFADTDSMSGTWEVTVADSTFTSLGSKTIKAKFYCDPDLRWQYKCPYEVDIPITVVQRPIAASITLSADEFEETEAEIKPDVTVRDGNGNIIPASGYTVTYRDNVEPGTARVIVKSKPDYPYSFEEEYSFTITAKVPEPIPDQPPFNLVGISGAVYGTTMPLGTTGGAASKTVTFRIIEGADIARIDGSNITFTGIGTVKVEGTSVAEGYNDATATTTIPVGKKQVAANITVHGKIYDGTTACQIDVTKVNGRVLDDNASDIDIVAEGTFADANAGDGKEVSIRYSLTGSKASYYALSSSQTATYTASISPAAIPADSSVTILGNPDVTPGTTAGQILQASATSGPITGNVKWYSDPARTQEVPAGFVFPEGDTTLYWKWEAVGNYRGTISGTAKYTVKVVEPDPVQTFDFDAGTTGIAAEADLTRIASHVLTARTYTPEPTHALLGKFADDDIHCVVYRGQVISVVLSIDGIETHDSFGSIKLTVPLDMRTSEGKAIDASKVTVHHLHMDGSITSQDCDVVERDGNKYVEFTVTDLSDFTITAYKAPETPIGPGEDDDPNNNNNNNNGNANANSNANANANANLNTGTNTNTSTNINANTNSAANTNTNSNTNSSTNTNANKNNNTNTSTNTNSNKNSNTNTSTNTNSNKNGNANTGANTNSSANTNSNKNDNANQGSASNQNVPNGNGDDNGSDIPGISVADPSNQGAVDGNGDPQGTQEGADGNANVADKVVDNENGTVTGVDADGNLVGTGDDASSATTGANSTGSGASTVSQLGDTIAQIAILFIGSIAVTAIGIIWRRRRS